jgi:tetratricopeptide (TPR) repeat protein
MIGLRSQSEECRGELLAREQRGQLSDSGSLALQAHLERCESCRLARQVFADFESLNTVDRHDGARIERLALLARRLGVGETRSGARASRSAKRVGLLALAACVVLMGGTASGAAWWWRQPKPNVATDRAQSLAPPERRALRARAAHPVPTPPTESLPVAPQALVEDAIQPSVVMPPGARAKRAAAALTDDSALTAPDLLRQAGAARRAGDTDRALGLYRELQKKFPRSSEAVLSAVSLGGVLLERRQPRAALSEFEIYLASSRGGALIPEALYGRGRALGQLGDRVEERRTWERLLSDFPDSAYGPLARRRLSELK